MLLQVHKDLYVGDTAGLVFTNRNKWSIIHLSQRYHYSLFGWDLKFNKPPKDHQHYLIYEEAHEISVNLVDGASCLFDWFGVHGFTHLMDFIDRELASNRKVLIHCDKGRSRSPSLALLYLSRRIKTIPGHSFSVAMYEFKKQYPAYNPNGIAEFIDMHWNSFK